VGNDGELPRVIAAGSAARRRRRRLAVVVGGGGDGGGVRRPNFNKRIGGGGGISSCSLQAPYSSHTTPSDEYEMRAYNVWCGYCRRRSLRCA